MGWWFLTVSERVSRGFAFVLARKWPQIAQVSWSRGGLRAGWRAAGGPGGSLLDTSGLAGVILGTLW